MPETLRNLLMAVIPVFTAPSGRIFLELAVGWILCPARRTVTGMIPFADPEGRRVHDAYHRFFREGAWAVTAAFRLWAAFVVHALCPRGILWLHVDDTVHKKTGRKVDGAKFCRDAVRSTKAKTVFAWGLQFVPLCLRVMPWWGGEPVAIPINVRLYRKGGPTLLDLAEEMIRDVAAWLPTREFALVADGFYAPLAGRDLPRARVVSRLRHDAALYALPPKRSPRARGRPRKKGRRLPTPAQLARRSGPWATIHTVERGKSRTRLARTCVVLWYNVARDRPILLVISRDPEGREKDDFFFTTDLAMAPETVIGELANRWAVEDTFRNVKQFLGAEEPQTWRGEGPEKAGAFAYLLYGVIWLWYLKHGSPAYPVRPWYPTKATPSFQDALAAVRRAVWHKRFSPSLPPEAQMSKIQNILIEALARAA